MLKRWRIFGFAVVILVNLFPLEAQGQGCAPDCQPVSTGPWKTFSVETTRGALPHDRISALWVEAGQAVWVGTDEGLSRYDGHEWQLYTREDGLSNNKVQALSGDGAGGLWAGTKSGLNRFNQKAGWQQFKTEDGLPDNWIKSLAPDGEGGLWIGTLRGLAHFDGYKIDLQIAELDGSKLGFAEDVLATDADAAFFGVDNEVFSVSSEGVVTRYHLGDGNVQALAYASAGRLWAGTSLGLYRFTGEGFELVSLADDPGEPEPDILSMAEDGAGGLWLGTTAGLWHFDGKGTDARLTVDNSGLASDLVQAISRADDGTLWLGTTAGVSRWNPEAWRAFPAAGSNIWAVAGREKKIWITSNEGLAEWDGKKWTLLSETASFGLWPDRDGVWFGTARGLHRLEANGAITTLGDRLADHKARVIAGDTQGNLWVGTDVGLFLLQHGKIADEYHVGDGLASDFVNALLVEPGFVWAGTNEGLSLREGGTWMPPITWKAGDIRANTVRALARGADGSVWAGTDAGLRRLPPGAKAGEASAWLLYTRDDGLASEAVNGLWADADGQLWVGTDGGLSGLDDNGTLDKSDDIWVSLTAEDGLAANRVTALWRDDQRVLWIGTSRAVTRHVPIPQAPSLQITGIWTKDGYVPVSEKPLDWREDDVDVAFAGGSLATELLAYRYQLNQNGWLLTSEDWVNVLPKPGGSYVIEVRAFDTDLNASVPASAPFSVQDIPVPRRWWFWPLLITLVVAPGAIGGYRVTRSLWGVRYADFALEVVRADANKLQVAVRRGRLGVVDRTELPLPWGEVNELARRVSADQYDPLSLEYLGRRLGDGVLSPKLRNRLGRLRWGRRKARLRLDLAADLELAGLPWELAFDPQSLGFLGQRADTALVRYLEPGEEWKRPLLGETLGVLVVMAQPREMEPLDLAQEKARLDKILTNIERVKVDYLYGVHAAQQVGELAEARDLPDQLAQRLADGWDVLHFVGHAGRDRLTEPPENAQVVLWCEDRRGDYLALGPQALSTMLNGLAGQGKLPKLVVLNACETANVESELTQTILHSGVGAVVGMQWPVLDVAAHAFADGFYSTLVRHGQVDYAVSVARSRMASEAGASRRDWGAPVLVMQIPDGRIFERA